MELTDEQTAILKTCRPPLPPRIQGWTYRKNKTGQITRVTASAGSGKTTTILQLAAHAVTNCGHQRINYATYTTAAAKDGKARMMQALHNVGQKSGQQAAPMVEARTLHSFAYQVLADHRKDDTSSAPRLWTEKKVKKWIAEVCADEVEEFLVPCYREIGRRGRSSHDGSISRSQLDQLQGCRERAYEQVLFFIFKSLILFTQSSMEIAKFERDKKVFGRDYYPAIIFHRQGKGEDYGFAPNIYNQPDKICFYSDQAAKCWRHIEKDNDIRTFDFDMKRVQLLKLRIPGSILLVDESQDMDACQIDWVVHQQAEQYHSHVYVVGDPAQAIYGFRGAKPKFLLQLRCDEKKLLTHTFRFGPAICNIANMILFAKEQSDQTAYNKFDNKPTNWDPYRTQSGVPDKICVITTDKSILDDWKSGPITLIARKNTTLLLAALPLFGFTFDDDYNSDDQNIKGDRRMSQDEGYTNIPTPVTQDEPVVTLSVSDDDYLPVSEHHVDNNVDHNSSSSFETLRPDLPRVHLNGKGQTSGRNLWLRTLKQVESAYQLYEVSSKDPDATAFLDPKQFPDFEKRQLSWRSFCDEVEQKELNKYGNVVGVVSKCKDKTIAAMQMFREQVITKNVPAEDADIILTTCHSAKGMEWPRVQLCDDFIDLCKFEKKNDGGSNPSSPAKNAKRQKRLPQWKFGFQAWGDDVNLLYVACTRTKCELSIPPSFSLIQVAKAFDELHTWKHLRDNNPGMVTQAISIEGVDNLISENDALGLYESLVFPLRREYGLNDDESMMREIFGVIKKTNNYDNDESHT